jgi:hypothetical protein
MTKSRGRNSQLIVSFAVFMVAKVNFSQLKKLKIGILISATIKSGKLAKSFFPLTKYYFCTYRILKIYFAFVRY